MGHTTKHVKQGISAAPTAQQEDGGESAVEENGTEIVLNASRLQVESEKWSKKLILE